MPATGLSERHASLGRAHVRAQLVKMHRLDHRRARGERWIRVGDALSGHGGEHVGGQLILPSVPVTVPAPEPEPEPSLVTASVTFLRVNVAVTAVNLKN